MSVSQTSLPEHATDAFASAASIRTGLHGVVLAGVHAWGENLLERAICRPLVRVASRPLICHTLAWLRDGGINCASVCANSDTVHLRHQLGDGRQLDLDLDYYEDVMPRGPAGCARDVAAGCDARTFLVVEGTLLPKIDVEDLLRSHENSRAILTVVVAAARAGESGPMQPLEPVGIHVFSRAAFEHVPATGYQDIKETLIPRLYARNQRVQSYIVDGISTPAVKGVASYLAVSEWAVEQLSHQEPHPGFVARDQARIHVSAQVDPTVRLVGPVWVEANCVIGQGALLIGPLTIGTGSTIGAQAVISRSAIWERCQVGTGVVLDQCILTDEASVEAGSAIRHQVVVPERRVNRSLLSRLFTPRPRASRAISRELDQLQVWEANMARLAQATTQQQAICGPAAPARPETGEQPPSAKVN